MTSNWAVGLRRRSPMSLQLLRCRRRVVSICPGRVSYDVLGANPSRGVSRRWQWPRRDADAFEVAEVHPKPVLPHRGFGALANRSPVQRRGLGRRPAAYCPRRRSGHAARRRHGPAAETDVNETPAGVPSPSVQRRLARLCASGCGAHHDGGSAHYGECPKAATGDTARPLFTYASRPLADLFPAQRPQQGVRRPVGCAVGDQPDRLPKPGEGRGSPRLRGRRRRAKYWTKRR